MKPAALKTTLSAALLLVAGAAFAQTMPAATPAPAQPAVPPPADPSLLPPSLPPMKAPLSFVCSDGQIVLLERDDTAGLVRGIRGGETFTLFRQLGYTPPRYVSGSDTIELGETEAWLRRGRSARQTCQRIPSEPTPGVVWGTLSKLDGMALPAGSRAKVLLLDGARMDAPAVEIGNTTITTTGNQVPLNFLLRFNAARTAHPARPMLQARIEYPKGRLLYVTDTVNALPTETAPESPIELKLVPSGAR